MLPCSRFLGIILALLVPPAQSLANTCSEPTRTIQDASDASVLTACTTFTGNIVIATAAAGGISLNGIRTITGNLTAANSSDLETLAAKDLAVIEGTFSLEKLDVLSELNLPSLAKVSILDWTDLPVLTTSTLVLSNVPIFKVSNTALKSFQGITFQQGAQSLNINNNPYLTSLSIDVPTIQQYVVIEGNPLLKIFFDDLQWANNITFRNSTMASFPSLTHVNTSMGLYGNTLTSFVAASLASVGGSLVIDGSTGLEALSFPLLKSIGGSLQISNTSGYQDVDGFDLLATVGGNISLSGNFSNVSLPALTSVGNGFIVNTSAPFDCTPFLAAKTAGHIKGLFTCHGTSSWTNSSLPIPTTTPHSTLSTPTKIAIVIPLIALLAAVVAAAFYYLRQRRRGQRRAEYDGREGNFDTQTELLERFGKGDFKAAEMDAGMGCGELVGCGVKQGEELEGVEPRYLVTELNAESRPCELE